MEEIWRDIVGYEGVYEISNLKNVRNKINQRQMSRFQRVKNGSWYVGLTTNGRTLSKRIDGLYETAFNLLDSNMDNTDVWVDIKGYEGYYQVSNTGKIRSMNRYIMQTHADGYLYQRFMKGKELSQKRSNGNDYRIVQLSKGADSKSENYYIHILVAEHFIPNPQNKPTVNHKNGIKSNNCVDNLEWATQEEQNEHALLNGLHLINEKGQRKAKYELSDDMIISIYQDVLEGEYTFQEIADKYQIPRIYVQNIKNKKNKRYREVLNGYDDILERIVRGLDEELIKVIYGLSTLEKYSDRQIANKFNIGISTVQTIRQGRRRLNITSNSQ